MWSIMKVARRTSAESVHWLLEEPRVYGATLDCTTAAVLHFSKILVKGKIITLRQLMAMAGPTLMDGRRVAEHLGMRSERIVGQMLGSCRKALSAEEWGMLVICNGGFYMASLQLMLLYLLLTQMLEMDVLFVI